MKQFLFILLSLSTFVFSYGENYNLISLSYNYTTFSYTDTYKSKDGFADIGGEGNSLTLNGFGIQYSYGIGLGKKPMNMEVGIKWEMSFQNNKNKGLIEGISYENKINNSLMRLDIPISYIYHIKISENFTVSPYGGLDLRYNLSFKTKDEIIIEKEYKGKEELNWFDKELIEPTPNRFQLGCHIGLRFLLKNFFIGFETGPDLTYFWSYKYQDEKAQIFTGRNTINIGLKF